MHKTPQPRLTNPIKLAAESMLFLNLLGWVPLTQDPPHVRVSAFSLADFAFEI
jgi:hypothetical protein